MEPSQVDDLLDPTAPAATATAAPSATGRLRVSGFARSVSVLSFGAEFRDKGRLSFGSGCGQFQVQTLTLAHAAMVPELFTR